ncbi:probable calcium-binding protein CML9 [Zea mays]|uniref:probable calcium-binding protein CML9 n=1 Tax=Zea mays TaxID=4577 RepID=UPI0004DE9AA3|nr:probable calcium-binding protein CML9 [Zea mays]|eukprot:XP_008657967.1 probable calcium-binding protein CML9 [Zea mays]
MAEKLTPEQVDECKEIFDLFDADEDGRIATGELVTALCSLGQNVDEAKARRFLEDAVATGAGDIDLAAFLAVAARKMGARQSEARLAECFDVFDDACSGSIPTEQLRQVMVSHGDRLTEEEGLRRGRGRTDCGGFCSGRREAGAVYNRDLIVSRDYRAMSAHPLALQRFPLYHSFRLPTPESWKWNP